MPTLKQRKVAKDLSENIGKPVSKAMRDAGYSDSTSKTPKRLTESKGWEELMEEYLPDMDLAKIHKRLLQKKEILVRNNNETGTIEKITTDQPHSDVKGALDMAYKLKGKYAPEKHEHTITESELDDELAELRARRAGIRAERERIIASERKNKAAKPGKKLRSKRQD